MARSYGVLLQQGGFAQNGVPPWCALSLRCKTWNPPKNKNPAKPGKFLVNAGAELVSVSETLAASTNAAGLRRLGYVD